MKLFHLPHLALIEVFKQLDPSEFFSISLCSKRSINVLKVIKYRNARLVLEPNKDNESTYGTTHWYISIRTRTGEVRIMNLTTNSMNLPRSEDVTVWKLGAYQIFIRPFYGVLWGYCQVQCRQMTRDFQKYMCDIFSLPTGIIFKDHGCQVYKNLIPNSIHTSNLREYPLNDFLEKFYNFHRNQVLSMHWFNKNFAEDMNNSHGIHQVENLIVPNSPAGIQWYMKHFQGKNALFQANMHTSFIVEFLEKWKQKTNDSLETFIVYRAPGELIENVQTITDGLEPWDTKKHGSIYPYNSIISRHHKFRKGAFDCNGGYFIRRETDGKVATLKLTPNHFMFFVWK